MKREKSKILTALIIMLGFLLLANTGCKKCYKCVPSYRSFKCINNTDTVLFGVANIPSAIIDSQNYYQAKGYTCDTGLIYYSAYGYGGPICGQRNYNDAIANGAVCVKQ